MALPQITGVNTSISTPNTTTHTVSLPATIPANNFIIVFASINGDPTVTPTAGWTVVLNTNAGGTNKRALVLAKKAAGTEGGTTIDFTTSAGEESAHVAITGNQWSEVVTDIEVSGSALNSSGTSANPPSTTASWGAFDNLFIALGFIRNGTTTVSGYPTGYTANQTFIGTGTGSGGQAMVISSKESTLATDDPDAYTLSSATAFIVDTLVIKGSAVAPFTVGTPDNTTPEEGEVVTIGLTNGTGPYTATLNGDALTLDSQNASQIVFTMPDIKTFGSKTASYNVAQTIIVTDTSDSDTDSTTVTPAVKTGDYHDTLTATTGIYSDDVGVAIGDRGYGTVISGTIVSADMATGAIAFDSGGGTFRYWVQDDTDGAWGASADEVVSPDDLVSPILTSPTGTETGDTTATGTVSTDEGAGTLYYYASTNGSETAATIKGSGSSQAVSTTGVQNVSFTGLTPNTVYYAHYVQDDASANESNAVSSTFFTTEETPDTTAPVLSSPTGVVAGATTGSGTVVTDEGNGVLYYYASTNVTETAATIKASGSTRGVTLAGSLAVTVAGLTPETTYYIHYVQDDSSSNESNVVSSSGFTTLAASDVPAASRTSVFQVANYLRSLGTYNSSQCNELVVEWLVSEGITRTQINQMLYAYLGGLGYTGSFNDRLKAWSEDV